MRFRLVRRLELEQCASLLYPADRIPTPIRREVPTVWRALLADGRLHGGVVVDGAAENGEAPLLAAGLTTFVDDAFVTEYLRAPEPYLSARIYDQILAGRSPVLPLKAIAAANAAGDLNLIILHFGVRLEDRTSGRLPAIAAAAHTGFHATHGGFRMRRVLQEAFGAAQLPFFRAGGFVIKADYSDYYRSNGQEPPSEDERPYLMGLFREDAESRVPGNAISALFQSHEPRFHFSPAEQQVLSHALMDESDEMIAEALAISRDAVKKTWNRIHQRIAAVPDLSGGEVNRGGSRGKERRRTLMHYLRYHLEELRPFARQR